MRDCTKSAIMAGLKILKPALHMFGYLVVDLHKNGKRKSCRVHISVTKEFIPNPENKPEVDHVFGNKLDASVWNLKWSTSSENKTFGQGPPARKFGVSYTAMWQIINGKTYQKKN